MTVMCLEHGSPCEDLHFLMINIHFKLIKCFNKSRLLHYKIIKLVCIH